MKSGKDIYSLYDFGGKTQEEWEAEHEEWEIPPLTPAAQERRRLLDQAQREKVQTERRIESERDALRREARKHIPALIADNGKVCQRCGTSENLTVDHIVALANGGTNDFKNLQLLCMRCNVSKGARE